MWARFAAWYRRRAGVRVRSALASAVVVALVLAVAGVAFVLLYRESRLRTVDAAATQHARTIAADISRAGVPRGALPVESGEFVPVQVVAPDGTVVASSAALSGRPPLSPLRPQAEQVRHEDRRLLGGGGGEYRVAAVGVATDQGTYTVLVGQSLEPVDDGVEDAVALLVLGYPLLVIVVAGATYLFVGRALAPVEAIRRKVSGITAARLADRVPVPAAEDEVARLAATMNTMLDRIESQVAAQRRFVADAGHELRSPLATLRSGLEVLGARTSAGRDAELSAVLQAEAARLGGLVDALLLLARADERGLRHTVEDVDLDDLVAAERGRLGTGYPHLKVTARLAPVRVRGDAGQLAGVLRNLADNAAVHAASAVEFTLSTFGGRAIVEVRDDGPGVPEADQERIFDRFVRLDESRRRASGGAGLGLAIVREIVAAHDGEVRVTAAPGGGALFRVELPLRDNVGPDHSQAARPTMR